jgi:tetratricopeptide (TPR) repeat protein
MPRCRTFEASRLTRIVLATFLSALLGCRRSALPSCTALIDAKKYDEALARCEQVYKAEGEPRAGAAVAEAHYRLGHPEQVLVWAKRLAGTAGERGTWSVVAAVHWQHGELAEAERAFRRDLALTRAAGDAKGMARPLYGLFYLAWADSRYREALRYASESFAAGAKAGDREAQSRAAEGLFTVLYDVGDREGARRALEMAMTLADEQSPTERARFLANEGLLLKAEGRPALGALRLEQAVDAGSDDQRTLRSAHLDLVEACLDASRLADAERHMQAAWKHAEPQATRTGLLYYQAALDLAQHRLDAASKGIAEALAEEPTAEWAWDLENLQGRVEEERGAIPAAETAYARSAHTVEEMRRSLELDDLKAWLLDKKRQPFESLFLLQARAGRATDALATAERAQARTLLDAFVATTSAPAGPGGAAPPNAAADRLETLRALLPAMSASPVGKLQPLPRVLTALGSRYGLSYFVARDEIWLTTVAGGHVTAHKLAASAAAIREMARRFAACPDDRALAATLGALLLPEGSLPAEAGGTLHIAIDGELARVPFAALRRADRYLVEDYALVYVPSLTALVAIEGRPASLYGPAVVLAAPRGDLPAAASEAIAVGRATAAVVRTSHQATAAELRRAAQATLLHLATHSGVGARRPWLSLADGEVGASEIVTGRIAPRLVVLASCASATRERREMWGSLAAAFLAAGARSALASLASVEDRTARDFVLRFYAEGGAEDPAGGLARAQRAAIAAGERPAAWAPFALFGAGGGKIP